MVVEGQRRLQFEDRKIVTGQEVADSYVVGVLDDVVNFHQFAVDLYSHEANGYVIDRRRDAVTKRKCVIFYLFRVSKASFRLLTQLLAQFSR